MSVSLPPLLTCDPSLPLAPPLRPLTLLSQKQTQGESDAPLLCPPGKVHPPSSPFCPCSRANRARERRTTRGKAPPLCTRVPVYTRTGGRTGRARPPFSPLPHLPPKCRRKVSPPFCPRPCANKTRRCSAICDKAQHTHLR